MWILLLILWPIAEFAVAFEVGRAIGFLLMILLIIASWPVGSWAMRSQGRVAMRHLREALAAGRPPTDSVLEGALVITVLSFSILGTQLSPSLIIGRVTPQNLLISITWVAGLWMLKRAKSGLAW